MSDRVNRSAEGMASATVVHARVAVRPVRHCPVTRLAGKYGLQELVPPGRGDRAPQVVVETTETAGLREVGAHPVARVDDVTVCRLPTLAQVPDATDTTACGHDYCLAHGFSFLPIDPYHTRWEGDVLHCSFAALGTTEIRRVVRAFGNADFVVELEQLVRGQEGDIAVDTARTAVCDLDRLTERQREVAAAAVERGYFEPDGPSADEMAEALDIAKPTLSEHLRTVQDELVRQAFSGDR